MKVFISEVYLGQIVSRSLAPYKTLITIIISARPAFLVLFLLSINNNLYQKSNHRHLRVVYHIFTNTTIKEMGYSFSTVRAHAD